MSLSQLTALTQEANRHLAAARWADAERVGRQLLGVAPGHPGALLVLSVVCMQQGRQAEAEAVLQRGRSTHPAATAFHAALAGLYLRTGRAGQALEPLEDCVLLEPSNRDYRRQLLGVYQTRQFRSFSEVSQRAMLACLADDRLTHSLMHRAWLSLLRLDPTAAPILEWLGGDDYESFKRRATPMLFDMWRRHELFNAGMSRFLVPEPAIERGLAHARRWFLEHAHAAEPYLPLVCRLAQYCFLSEYAFIQQEDVTSLRYRPSTAIQVALLACYEPLALHPDADCFAALSKAPEYCELIRALIDEPRREWQLAQQIPTLSPIKDEISRAVQHQYEQHPYPRWQTVGTPRTPSPSDGTGRRILIAGCGTGRDAVEMGMLFPSAQVEAIDLSRASLSFAMRKAGELGVANVGFQQADLLDVERLGRSFDLIVASGVLHHMDVPVAGLRALLGVLAPGGILRVALYSKRGRQEFSEARRWARSEGLPTTLDGIRSFRSQILSREKTDPLRKRLVDCYDFYSTSQCRDLVFHVREHCFTLPEIAAICADLGLAVLRLDMHSPTHLGSYRERFPDDPAATNLAHWHAMEQEHPTLFANMYSLWLCRANERAASDPRWVLPA